VNDTSGGKQKALARADDAWRQWEAFLKRESTSGNAEERGSDGWTLAEAVAHVARWQAWSTIRLQHVLDGGRLEQLAIDEINAKWAAEDRGIAYEEAARRMQEAWRGLRAKTEEVPDERWNGLFNEVVKANTWEHFAEHMEWRPAR
jgi:hypothetical protein